MPPAGGVIPHIAPVRQQGAVGSIMRDTPGGSVFPASPGMG